MFRLILILPLIVLMISCKDDPVQPEPPTPTISVVDAPEFLLCQLDSVYLYQVRVENLDDVELIMCTITRPNGTGGLSFELYDDGNSSTHVGPDFVSETSLDAVPNNGTFTRGIQSDLFCQEGEGIYQFHFVTMGGSQVLEVPNLDVEVRSIDDCVFGNVEPVQSLEACFTDRMVSVMMFHDPDYAIDSVRALWISGDTLWWSELFTGGANNEWHYTLSPSLFGCTPSGNNYTLRCEAYNRFGLNCAMDETGISFVNALPVLSAPQMADTMYRPNTVGDSDTLQFFIRSDDCDLVGRPWTQAVQFQVSRDDTLSWLSDPFFFLRDDGVPPDNTPGDGLASSYLVVMNRGDGLVDNMYYFKFFSVECSSGDTSVALYDSTRIILPGELMRNVKPTAELGLSSFK